MKKLNYDDLKFEKKNVFELKQHDIFLDEQTNHLLCIVLRPIFWDKAENIIRDEKADMVSFECQDMITKKNWHRCFLKEETINSLIK